MNILVVDDDPDLRETVQAILEGEGYDTVGASDGIEAFERLRPGPAPSLILLDLMMPRMSGWEFRAAQMVDPKLAGIPVVVMTASSTLSGGAVDVEVLFKPVPYQTLLETVARYCRT